jgi:hypothetical protein
MTPTKRLRILWAVLTQDWQTFHCPCGKESWILGTAHPLLDGQMCDECEAKEFERWMQSHHEQEMA